MAYSFDLNTDTSISFGDFTENVSKTLDPKDTDSILACTEYLQQLSNNREFLVDFLNDELKDLSEFQKNSYHSSQTLLLHSERNFYIRANIWPPVESNAFEKKWENELYLSLKAHDHNFNFLTVGYLGSGYTTEIWEYDYDSVVGYPGEKVALKFLEKTTLPVGKVMFYRASADIHAQFPPDDYSMSINIMPYDEEFVHREQFWFDLKKKTIVGHASNAGTGRYLILDLAKIFGNTTTVNLVEEISKSHEVPHVRVKGFDVLAHLAANNREVWKEALKDKHKTVQKYAELALDGAIDF